VLWWLGASFCFFSIFIHIWIFTRAIETKATKLYSRSINSMIPWHYNSFLLFEYATLKARAPARSSCGFVSRRSISTDGWTSGLTGVGSSKGSPSRIFRGCHSACSSSRRHWTRDVWKLLNVALGQLIFRRCNIDAWLSGFHMRSTECTLSNGSAIGGGRASGSFFVMGSAAGKPASDAFWGTFLGASGTTGLANMLAQLFLLPSGMTVLLGVSVTATGGASALTQPSLMLSIAGAPHSVVDFEADPSHAVDSSVGIEPVEGSWTASGMFLVVEGRVPFEGRAEAPREPRAPPRPRSDPRPRPPRPASDPRPRPRVPE
jgi:hypothetical protein